MIYGFGERLGDAETWHNLVYKRESQCSDYGENLCGFCEFKKAKVSGADKTRRK